MADITKYGPQSWRDLQKENSLGTEGLQSFDELTRIRNASMSGRSGVPSGDFSESIPYGADNPMGNWGTSSYDDEIINAPMNSGEIQDTRYENQPWYDTLANGIGKMLGTAGTTFVSSLVGLPYGLGAAVNQGRWSALWDNDVTQGLAEVDNWLEENMTNYRSQVQQNSPWYSPDNLFSMNFIADDVIKNAGFTLGAAASMAVGSGSLGLMSKALGFVNDVGKGTKMGQAALAALFSATGEGMIEARQGVDERNKLEMQRLEDEFAPEYNALQLAQQQAQQNYAMTGDFNTYKQEMVDIENQKRMLDQRKNAGIQQIQESGQEMGNTILLANQALLTLGNLIQFGKGAVKSFDAARHAAEVTSKAAKPFGVSATKAGTDLLRTGYKITGKNLGRTVAATKGLLTEGSEEMNQQWIQSGAGAYYNREDVNDYWKAKMDPEATKDTTEGLYTFGKALDRGFQESWGDIDQWEQFVIGGITGMAGSYSPTKLFNQDKTKGRFDPRRYGSWEGGAYNALKDFNEQYSQYEENINEVNKILQSEDFPAKVRSMVGHSYTQTEKEAAAEADDKKAWKDADDKQNIHDVQSFLRAGKLDDLRAIYKQLSEDMSDEDVENVIKRTTREEKDENGQPVYIGPYVDKKGNKKPYDEVRNNIKHNSEELNRKLDSYLDSIDAVNKMTNGQLSKDQEDNLAYLHNLSKEKLVRFDKIMADVRKKLPSKFLLKTTKSPEQLASENASSDLAFSRDDNTPAGYVEVDTSLMNDKAFGNFFMNTVMYGNNIKEKKGDEDNAKKEEEAEKEREEQRNINVDRYKKNFYDTMRQGTNMTLEEIRDAFEDLRQDIYDASVLQNDSQEFWNTYMEYMMNPNKVDTAKEKEEKKADDERQKQDIQEMSIRDLAQRTDLKELLAQAKTDSDIPLINKIKKAMLLRQQKAKTSSAGRDNNVLAGYEAKDKELAIQAQLAKLEAETDRVVGADRELSMQELSDSIKGVDLQTVRDIVEENLSPVDKARLTMLAQEDPDAFEKEMAERENAVLQAMDELEEYTTSNLPDIDGTVAEPSDKDLEAVADKVASENPKGPAEPKKHDEVNPVISVPTFASPAPVADNNNDSISDESVLEQDMQKGMEGVTLERSGQHPWRAVTRRVGYHTNEPYSNTLENLIANTTDDAKRAPLEKQLKRVKAVEKFLEEKGAFTRVEQGIAKGTVKFAVSKKLNDEAGDFVILMIDNNGIVLADLPSGDIDIEPNTNQIPGLADLYEEARRQWNEVSDTDKENMDFLPLAGLQTKIDFTYFGKVLYQDERQSVNDLFGNEKFTLALRVGESGSSDPASFLDTGKKSLAGKIERSAIREPLTGSKGQPYVLIPTSKAKNNTYGEGYLAVPILTPMFGELNQDTMFYKVVRDILQRIKEGRIQNKQAKEMLQVLFGVSNVHVNFDGDLSKKGSGITLTTFVRANQSEKGNPHDIFKGSRENLDVDAATEALGNFFINISNKKINTSEVFYTLPNGDKIYYNAMIGEIATTNAAMPHTVNDFFTVVPLEKKDGKFQQVESKPVRMKFPKGSMNSVFHVKVQYKDGTMKMWHIDPSENFVCRDEQGRPIYKEDNVHTASEKKLAAQYRAEAFGRFYMKDFSHPFAVMLDDKAYLYDPATKSFKTAKELEKTAPRYNKALSEYDALEDMLASMEEAMMEAEETKVAADGANKEKESLIKEGDSILRKLGYKSKDRHSNGHVRGGQSGWKLRFVVKNPATGKAFTQEEVNADKDAYLNAALPLLNWLKEYFSNPDGSDTISTSKPQSNYGGYAAHYHFTDKDGHSREPFKFLTGGEVGEADFTIYIGSMEDVEKFMSDVENSPINDALAVGNNNKSDIDFNGKIHGRIEGRSIGFSGYMLPDGLNKMLPEETTVYEDDRVRIFISEKEYLVEDKKENKLVVPNYTINTTPGSAQEYVNNNILHIRNTIARNVYGDFIAQDNKKENRKVEKEKTIKRVEATITKLQNDGAKYIVCDVNGNPDPNGDYYEDDEGLLHARVTSIAEGDPYVEPFKEVLEDGTENPWILPSTTIGNQVDEFIRVFFEGGDPMSINTPNLSQKSRETLLEKLKKIQENINKDGWKVASRNIVASGVIGVTDANGDNIIVRVAGTLDLLLYNPEKDEYAIYDIKTHRNNIDFNNVENDSHMGKWSAQLSLYKELLEAKYPELGGKIIGLRILPIKVSSDSYDVDKHKYSMNGNTLVDETGNTVVAEVKYDGQTIPIKERSLKINMGKKGFKAAYNSEEGKKQIIFSKPRPKPSEAPKQKVKEGILKSINKIPAGIPVEKCLKDDYKSNQDAVALCTVIEEARKDGTLADLMLTEATMNMLSDMLNDKRISNYAARSRMGLEGLGIPGEKPEPKAGPMFGPQKSDAVADVQGGLNDELYPQVKDYLESSESHRYASAVQRHFVIGYNRADRMFNAWKIEQSTNPPASQQDSVEDKAKQRKILDSSTERAWNRLSEENKKKVADTSNVIDVKRALQDAQKNPRKNPNQAIEKYLHRKAVDTVGYKKLNMQKELEWLNSVLPQLSRNNKIKIINGLIKCSDGTWDYGQMKNGLIYIGTNGKEGTVYHEAFHAVTQWILTDDELNALYEAARERYGNLDTVILEEKMADDFMLYTMGVKPSYKPKHQNIFKRLWDTIKKMFRSTNMIDRLYQNINDGVYAGKVLRTDNNEFADITSEDRSVSMGYAFLDNEQREKLKDNNVTREQYEVLDNQERRYLFHCVL